jgi:sugar-specific transcriptional regulator TrmB
MVDNNKTEAAVEGLRQLGLKKYEAEVFVGLSQMDTGTAKDVSELTEVPRTRVYDSIRVLESEGLVEVQHTNPKRFRAVPLEEATDTLRKRYNQQIEKVENALSSMEQVKISRDEVQEVWSLSGSGLVETRSNNLIDEAESEVVLIIGNENLLTDDLIRSLKHVGTDVNLFVGTVSDDVQEKVKSEVPRAETFESGLRWMRAENSVEDKIDVGRLLLVDRSSILVSSIEPDTLEEYAVFGEGFGNGLLVIARRIMATGLVPELDSD